MVFRTSSSAIINSIDRLPTNPTTRYPDRSLTEINQIIIHHSAVNPTIGPERLAKIQTGRGKPGLGYHFFIAGDGRIYQTNSMTVVAAHSAGYDQNSVAICFAGNFTQLSPNAAQLQAGGELIRGLMSQLNIPPESIKGASELIPTQSPGKQWLAGRKWKNSLLAQLSALSTGQERTTGEGRAQIAALQNRIAELERQLRMAQEAAISAGGVSAGSHPLASGSVVSQPAIEDIVDALPRHPNRRYQTRSVSAINNIIVHHTAAPASFSAEQIASFNINKNNWPGFGFHYFIGADGLIQQTNDLTTISYHAGSQNPTSLGVAFAGDFDDNLPAPAQITAGAHLIAWLLDHLNLPLMAVHGHKEFADTNCPGEQWDKGAMWRNTLLQAIQDNLADAGVKGVSLAGKTLYHYLLFWQTEDDWAKKDLLGAMNYIGKFRPSLGFSLDDAVDAEYVTIVGGPLGVSIEAETRLKASGCQVERVAGHTELATQALLDDLARQNKRFLTLEA